MNYKYKTLFLTEKDSQVVALADVLGAKYNRKWYPAYNEKDGIAIVPLQGHLLQNLEPHEYDASLKSFGEESIYVFPEKLRMKPTPSKRELFDRAIDHIKNSQEIVIATDFDAEGAAIAMNMIDWAKARDRIKFMLDMGSTHPKELRKNIDHPRGIDYKSLAASGRTRSFIDWAEGMSLSRALTYYLGNRGAIKLNFGGVKSPIIYIVVNRDLAFESHKPEYFYTATGFIKRKDGTLVSVSLKKKDTDGKTTDRFSSQKEIEDAINAINNKSVKISSVTRRVSKTVPPKLYELAALQADMSRMYKVDLSNTMAIAQKLYDQPISIQTYPRTDTPFLRKTEYEDVPHILNNLKESNAFDNKIIDEVLSKKIPQRPTTFNDKEVTAHGAIVPTISGDINSWITKISDLEKKEFTLVANRYIANFMDDYEYMSVSGQTDEINGYFLTFTENIPKKAGWKLIYEKNIQEEIDSYNPQIPNDLAKGEDVLVQFDISDIHKGETKPKPRFTAYSLVMALQNVASLFPESEEIKEHLGENGIGTNATRAAIIDQLLSPEFNKGQPWLVKDGDKIISTKKAREFIEVIPEELVSPIKRAELSKRLTEIQQGDTSSEDVINGYRDEVRHNIEVIKEVYEKNGPMKGAERANGVNMGKPLGKCPVCKTGDIVARGKIYMCSEAKIRKEGDEFINDGCDYKIFQGSIARFGQATITEANVKELLSKGSFEGKFKSKAGKPYSAPVVVDEQYGVKVDFDAMQNNFTPKKYDVIGKCPLCQGDLLNKDALYECANRKSSKDEYGNWTSTGCTYKLFKTALSKFGKKTITVAEMKTLASKGEVTLKLMNTKNGKPFDAKVVVDSEWGCKIEFK